MKLAFIETLEGSPYRKCRLWTKVFFTLILYMFVIFYGFIANDVLLLVNQNLLQSISVTTVNSTVYTVVTSNFDNFQTIFSATSQTLEDLVGMNCLIDSYNGGPVYSTIARNTSSSWIAYVSAGLISFSNI